ncbi:WD40 repeat-like protein [Aaosphaeria arxii CBS 175.79]|uniref:WD40 repeat-like protein n=1 Tax=Aaosphaeria arxii CBS 175.79 TaxID=1450172 RepID=A0A6A5XIF1_9PLEO|nr:WD40 repeat-like protein [Aaosphaeria arxii CBS 175.79]KAF2012560.1 WD40 repeat-like protein [Aaosphaeria arxii CBS 175.79]
MAWQSPSAMNAGGAPGGGDGSGATGTEYTLQGVMRFLQLEWHNHERARNAWDIERAEMKAKIAKQEGEVRSAKKLNDQLNKHIRMLEQALLNERNKNKAPASGGDAQSPGEDKKDSKGKAVSRADVKSAMGKHHNSFLDVEPENAERADAERDSLREKSKLYLTQCVKEITYLLTPPQSAPAQSGLHAMSNGSGFLNHGDAPMEEMYLQHQQRMQRQLPTGPNTQSHQANMSNLPDLGLQHQPHPSHQAPQMQRENVTQQSLPSHSGAPTDFLSQQQQNQHQQQSQQQPPQQNFTAVPDEQVERVTHAYDNHGRPIAPREEAPQTGQVTTDDSESWNFEEPINEVPLEAPQRRLDVETFPDASKIPSKSPPRKPKHDRKSSFGSKPPRRLSEEGLEIRELKLGQNQHSDPQNFKVRFALRGHLDVVRSVIFTGGGSPSEPEICTAGDDGLIKRWIIPASYASQHSMSNDLDISPYWSHRGHDGVVTSLAACPSSASFATGGRVSGDGWIFSGGQDATVRVWERGRVDPKATLEGHTDAVWTVCVLPTNSANVFGSDSSHYGGPDRILLASGSADGTIKIWAVSAPPQLISPQSGSRRGVGGSRRHSVTSGSNFPSSPQPSVATTTPFHYTLIHTIERATHSSPTCITPLSPTGENFVVSFSDATILLYDTRTGEEIIGMASGETYDGTPATGITSVVATSVSIGAEGTTGTDSNRGADEEGVVHGPTGSSSGGGVEGHVISGHEDKLIRFYDANSGQCTYSMLAHPAAISSLSLSKDGREAVSAGHDASIRFWSLEKRICTQEITAHRIMRGEGVCSVVWSQDGRLVVSAGGDGVVKVFSR